MIAPARTASALRSCMAIAAVWAFGWGPGAALGQTPRPAAKAAAPAAGPAALDLLKQRDQELDTIRAEQRKSTETEQRLATENDSVAEERRKLNQALIDAASRI